MSAFPINKFMHDQVKFMSINSQIMQGTLEKRVDRDGNMPSDEDITYRFWSAYKKLQEEIINIKHQLKTEALEAENAQLKAQLEALSTTKKEKKTKTKNGDIPFQYTN